MKAAKIYRDVLSWVIIVMLTIPPVITAQDSGQTEQPAKFKKEELAQMLAPIALYPDSLLADALMAATYPVELVEAERWTRKNKNLKGDELDRALQEKAWDASVKSLCHFPEVLYAMSDKLDQTTKLGDAFLSRQDDVMDTVQELRRKAQEQGNLKTTKEQKVVVEEDVIKIEPANPEVIYVPIYDPIYVYGPWWYPAYPPYYWYYPPGVVIAGGYTYFGLGIFVGIGISSWCWFDWHHHHVYIDRHHARPFHRFDRPDIGRHIWKHAPVHRKGVAYRDRAISERFGARPLRVSPASPETRGYPARGFERKAVEPLRGPIERREVIVTPRIRPKLEGIQRTPLRDTPFRGIGDGSFERRAGERGNESRRSINIRRPGGEIKRQGGDMRQQGGGPSDSGRGGTFRR